MRKAVGVLAISRGQSKGRDEGTEMAVRQTPYEKTVHYNITRNKNKLRKT